jgi:hypothetical protein
MWVFSSFDVTLLAVPAALLGIAWIAGRVATAAAMR